MDRLLEYLEATRPPRKISQPESTLALGDLLESPQLLGLAIGLGSSARLPLYLSRPDLMAETLTGLGVVDHLRHGPEAITYGGDLGRKATS